MKFSEKRKTLILLEGEVNFELFYFYSDQNAIFISNNAYVASCLKNGIIFAYGQGETTIEVMLNQNIIDLISIVVLPSGYIRYPLYVNRWNGVPRDRIPFDLVKKKIGTKYYSYVSDVYVCKYVADAYEMMARTAEKKDGIFLKARHGYRSFIEQENIIKEAAKNKPIEAVLKKAAPPGFSEHHTGLAMDVSGMIDENGIHVTENKDAFAWLADNCHKFGFMIKNLKGKEHITGTIYEPWHIRYIGDKRIASILHENYLTLDEYLEMESNKYKKTKGNFYYK